MESDTIWKYFKIGDIVKYPEVWGDNKLFQVYKLSGNSYLPILNVCCLNKPKTCSNLCNFDARKVKLYDSPHRPFRKLSLPNLIKIMNKGNVEAKREFLIRVQHKNLK